MITHYNAFISYRHAPLDIRVAAEIQKQLERFSIPKPIQKATGVRKIDRIFRDKEELPITSDLNETIENALQNSDYLIVICSQSTKESVWVQREIAFFLKSHSRKQVLTVVAEGEPTEVIPDILKYQEATVTLDSGETEVVEVPIEPLACDYRRDFRKARREELPRLAAALISCSYDELKQRQRQYRLRRLTAAFLTVFAGLLSLSVYFAWSNAQIQTNYKQSLINQSKYLSTESLALLNQGDRISAMLLALEALPQNEQDARPVIAQAEFALSQAVNAYAKPGNTNLLVESAFHHGGVVKDFLLSENETHLIVLHSSDTLTVWNAQTREKIQELVLPYQALHIALTPEDTLMVTGPNRVDCMDYRTGSTLWSSASLDDAYPLMAVSPSASLVCYATGHDLILADTATGNALHKAPLPTYTDDYGDSHPYDVEGLYSAPDGQRALLLLAGNDACIALWDAKTQEFTLTAESVHALHNVVFTDDAILYTAVQEFRPGNARIGSAYIYDTSYADLICLNSDGTKRWEQQLAYSQFDVGHDYELMYFPYPRENGQTTPAVIATAGEKMAILDIASGKILDRVDFPSVVVELALSGDTLLTAHVDGSHFNYVPTTDSLISVYAYVEKFDHALLATQHYICFADNGTILRYASGLYDDQWKPLSSEGVQESVAASAFRYNASDQGKTLLYASESFAEPFMVANGKDKTSRLYPALPEEGSNRRYFLGFDHSGDQLLFTGVHDQLGEGYAIGAFDLQTGRYDPSYIALSAAIADKNKFYQSEKGFYYLTAAITDDRFTYSIAMRSADGNEKTIPLSFAEEGTFFTNTFLLNPQEDTLLMTDGQQRYDIIDLKTGKATVTEPMNVKSPLTAWCEDGQRFVAADQNCIRLMDVAGNTLLQISCNGLVPSSFYSIGDQLYVIYGNNSLYCYSLTDGSFLSKINLSLPTYVSDFVWEAVDDRHLAIYTNGVLNLLDIDALTLKACISDCSGYSFADNIVFMGAEDDDGSFSMGYYTIYSYQDLLDMARKQLGDTALTPAQVSEYGINRPPA